MNTYRTALMALRSGLSFVPIVADGTKRPAVKWKIYQERKPTVVEVRRWFQNTSYGIALITGQISGGLEMLDFDSAGVYERFRERSQLEGLSQVLGRIEGGYKERSPNGLHLYYRCPFIEKNKKLAQRPVDSASRVQCQIETRGEGGYSIAAPSSGSVHPSRRSYEVVQGSIATIPTITIKERALILSVARTLDEMPALVYPTRAARGSSRNFQESNGGRLPGQIFCEQATWAQILEPCGWTRVKSIGEEDFWCRPGKEKGLSATTNYENSDFLYVFSTSTIFEPRVGISKFAAYTFLEHHGDFSAATKTLAAQGYVEAEEFAPVL